MAPGLTYAQPNSQRSASTAPSHAFPLGLEAGAAPTSPRRLRNRRPSSLVGLLAGVRQVGIQQPCALDLREEPVHTARALIERWLPTFYLTSTSVTLSRSSFLTSRRGRARVSGGIRRHPSARHVCAGNPQTWADSGRPRRSKNLMNKGNHP